METALEAIRQLAESNTEITLLNTYKGIPFSHPAQFVEKVSKIAALATHPHQLICIHYLRNVFIMADVLPQPILGHALDLQIARRRVLLHDFEFASPNFGKRASVRAVPRDRTFIQVLNLSRKGKEWQGEIQDISIGGAGLKFPALDPDAFAEGDRVQLAFSLPDAQETPQEYHLTGEIRYLADFPTQGFWRMGIQTAPEGEMLQKLEQYMEHRRAEVLAEFDAFEPEKKLQ